MRRILLVVLVLLGLSPGLLWRNEPRSPDHSQRVELTVEQRAPVEVDQALRPVVGEVAETRSLAGGKDDCLHFARRFALEMRRRLGISVKVHTADMRDA